MKALCIDPGTEKSGIVEWDGENVSNVDSEINNNYLLTELYDAGGSGCVDIVIIEMISSYGMAVGKTTFETCIWIGRFMEAFGPYSTKLVYRRDVKMHLCNSMRAKDKNIRQAVFDRFPATGGGKTPQIGTKKQPGPLYGVTSHAMSSLALGITYFETEELKKKYNTN